MKIEKRYLDNLNSDEPDKVFNSIDEVRDFHIKRGERIHWVNFLISQLESKGRVSDRFAEYKIIYQNGDTVTVLPEIFNING